MSKAMLVMLMLEVATVGTAAGGAVRYTLTDLGTLGGARSEAMAINNRGQIVGWSDKAEGSYGGFIYDGTGPMQPMGVNYPVDINDAGQILHPNLIYESTTSTGEFLGTLGGSDLDARKMNKWGHAVGWSSLAGLPYQQHAFLYRAPGQMADLGSLGDNSYSFGINDRDESVGYAYVPGSPGRIRHAIYWSDSGAMQDLGTLGGTSCAALDINNSGLIVGAGTTADGLSHVFVYDGTGPLRDLGTLPGRNSYPRDINNLGQFVGDSGQPGDPHAFIGSPFEPLQDLNDLIDPALGWTLTFANEINDLGWVVGNGITPSGATHAYLLTPIPEPATLGVIGVLGLLFFRKRTAQMRGASAYPT